MPTNPLKTGDYIINFFNHYGARLKDLEQQAACLTQAQDQGHDSLVDPDTIKPEDRHYLPVSFVVDRRVYNSLDK